MAARISALEMFSKKLGFAPQHIYTLCSKDSSLYRSIELPKNRGLGVRRISIPRTDLKGVQRVILRKILAPVGASKSVYSYKIGVSICDAGRQLLGGKAVLKVDIKDFFPSITSGRVYGLFFSLGFSKIESFLLTRLTTHNGSLAQGAPTSPYISNLIGKKLDEQMELFCKSLDMNYLRYSDDIYVYSIKNFNKERIFEFISKIISDNGFRLNETKTRYYPKGCPRITLGLSTHGRNLQIPRMVKRRHRALFYKAAKNPTWGGQNLPILRGVLAWHVQVYGRNSVYKDYKSTLDILESLRFHESYGVN